MDELINFVVNSAGGYDLGSVIKLFGMMLAMDGIIFTIYAVLRGARR